ncbi:MAG: M23 family metallopeptidase [Lysobacterales bacterium]
MNNKLSLMLATGKDYLGDYLGSLQILGTGQEYLKSLQGEQGRRVVTVLLVMLAVSMFVLGRWTAPTTVLIQQKKAELKLEIMHQKNLFAQLSREQENNLDALAARLAELQAASTRLDALGERLVQLGQLDPEEFDFSQPPPVGGPEMIIKNSHSSVGGINESISILARVMGSQFARLDALQLLLLDRNLDQERTPAGWPVSSGYISSGFGERNDPFTGKRTQHEGLDFVGAKGSEVLAVASGAVTWAGPRHGYGNLLEINHGNGYVTRYAHNDKLLVKAGDSISAGQEIAEMGATGRASAPHVHFEVLYKGKPVNPSKFVKQGR